MRASSLLVLAATLFTACGPPVLKGRADLTLRSLLDTKSAPLGDLVPLLSPEVVLHRGDEVVRGVDAAAALLAEVKPEGTTDILRHHQVSLVLLGDGRSMLLERGPDDRIVRIVEVREPTPSDGLPPKMVFYGAAWNTDPAKERRALIQASYAEDGYYVDPGHEVRGVDEVTQMIGNLRMVAPGSLIHYATGVAELGGGWATEDWVMVSRLGGRVLFRGIDIMHFGDDGKIDYLAGFIGTRTRR